MLRVFRRAAQPCEPRLPALDDLFLERYQSLLARALHLTHGDREDASDLVQDAYVHFVLGQTPIESIQDLDAYLHAMVRYMHVSRIRGRVRHPQTSLELLEHDFAEIALRAAGVSSRYQVFQELRGVVEAACVRRHRSKTASVLLLRYFHGYYVREIASILKTPPRVVDNLLHVARREVRSWAADPGGAAARRAASDASTRAAWTRAECLDDLRAAIFGFAHQLCYPDSWFQECYRTEDAAPLDCATVAALVTCPRCLDGANAQLGLPLLAERYPTDTLGPDRRTPPGGGAAGGGMNATDMARMRRKVIDVIEHKPLELLVSVNGFVVASQTIGGECTEQTVSITIAETPGFVEVFSEQQVQLLFLMVQPPPEGALQQGLQVPLSDGRSLAVELSFSATWPALRIVYRDPHWHHAAAAVEMLPDAAERVSVGPWRARGTESPRRVAGPGWLARLRRGLRAIARPRSMPATMVLVFLTWIALQYFRDAPDVSARELLQRSAAAEDAVRVPDNLVRHRIVDVEERRPGDGVLLSRTSVESWHGSAGRHARRRYDASGMLLALELTTGGQGAMVYRPDAAPVRAAGVEMLQGRALDAGELWRFDPSARSFAAMVADLPEGVVQATSAEFVIEYRAGPNRPSNGLVRALLRLARDGLHPVAQVVVVATVSGLREYRFTERLSDVVPERLPGRPPAFEPDAMFAPAAGSGPEQPPAGINSHLDSLSGDEQAALQVEALFLLDQAGATLGDQIDIAASSGGVYVRVLVDSARRKREVVDTLSPLARNPYARVEVTTVREAAQGRRPDVPSIITREVGPVRPTIGAFADLHRYLRQRPGSNAGEANRDRSLEREVTEFAGQALGRARQGLLRAWALEHLVNRIPPARIGRLDASARAKWRSMVRQHALAFLRATELLRLEVEPVFLVPRLEQTESTGGEAVVTPGESQADAGMVESVHRLLALAIAQDEAVRSAFTLPTHGTDPIFAVKTPQFWERVRQAETIAKRLAEID